MASASFYPVPVDLEPYFEDNEYELLTGWVEENIKGHHLVIAPEGDDQLCISGNGMGFNFDMVFLFQDVNDAIMFKLRWGGR